MIDYLLNKASRYFNAKQPEDEGVEVNRDAVDKTPKQIMLAKSYHGMHEKRNKGALRMLLGFNPATTPWCAGFVNAIEKKCGRKGTGKLLARSYLKYGTPTDNPKKGDIVVFKRGNSSWQGHVGYYIFEDKNGILTLGGNQNNKVCYKYYPKSKVLGYRRP